MKSLYYISSLISPSSAAAAASTARNSGTSHSEELPWMCSNTHTHTSVLIYAAFNLFFISYFTSLWILFLSSWAVEVVNVVFYGCMSITAFIIHSPPPTSSVPPCLLEVALRWCKSSEWHDVTWKNKVHNSGFPSHVYLTGLDPSNFRSLRKKAEQIVMTWSLAPQLNAGLNWVCRLKRFGRVLDSLHQRLWGYVHVLIKHLLNPLT